MPEDQEGRSEALRQEATAFLQSMLLDRLSSFTYYITGSYALDVMAWPDIDINVLYDDRLEADIYMLGSNLLESLNPSWLELRNASAELNTPGHFFLGFETTIGSTLWNVDLWFQSQHQYTENHDWLVAKKQQIDQSGKSAIVDIKRHLIEKGVYPHEVSSMKIYEAVLDHGVLEPIAFDEWYSQSLSRT